LQAKSENVLMHNDIEKRENANSRVFGCFLDVHPSEAKLKSIGAKLKGLGQSYIVSKTAFR